MNATLKFSDAFLFGGRELYAFSPLLVRHLQLFSNLARLFLKKENIWKIWKSHMHNICQVLMRGLKVPQGKMINKKVGGRQNPVAIYFLPGFILLPKVNCPVLGSCTFEVTEGILRSCSRWGWFVSPTHFFHLIKGVRKDDSFHDADPRAGSGRCFLSWN